MDDRYESEDEFGTELYYLLLDGAAICFGCANEHGSDDPDHHLFITNPEGEPNLYDNSLFCQLCERLIDDKPPDPEPQECEWCGQVIPVWP